MHPNSPFWQPYTNSDTHIAQYSIAIARNSNTTNLTSNKLPGDVFASETSNFTLGWANDAEFVNQSSVFLTCNENFTYSLTNFSFGPVYYANGS